MTIFQCFDDEFGCPDGICISMAKRCDGVPDCIEEFDETMYVFLK